jgi:hypothetical protein
MDKLGINMHHMEEDALHPPAALPLTRSYTLTPAGTSLADKQGGAVPGSAPFLWLFTG